MPQGTIFIDLHAAGGSVLGKRPVHPVTLIFGGGSGLIDTVVTTVVTGIPVNVGIAPRGVAVEYTRAGGSYRFEGGAVLRLEGCITHGPESHRYLIIQI